MKAYHIKSIIANYITILEKTNAETLDYLNELLNNEDCENIKDDIQYALDNDFCKGEHLLKGLLETIESNGFKLHKKLNNAETAINSMETKEDYIKYGLNPNRSELMQLRLIIGILRAGEKVCYTACQVTKNFFEQFGIESTESNNRCYVINPI